MNKTIVLLSALTLFSLPSCGIQYLSSASSCLPEKCIELYSGEAFSYKDYQFHFDQFSYLVHGNNVLELDFGFRIKNVSKTEVAFTIPDAKAFGNGTSLTEQVLATYDASDKSKNQVFESKEENLNSSEEAALHLYLVIQDGNPSAKYQVDLTFNDFNVSLFSYKKGYELERFIYVHDPTLYSKVLKDAEVDQKAIYGFKPNATGSLKQYVDYAWESEEEVEKYKQERIKYISENDQILKNLESKLREEGKSIEEIARACSSQRNQNRLDQYKDDPEGLEKLKERNLEKYGHEEGPLPDELYAQYGSWEVVLEKCYASNAGMDACCGVYDTYFCMYTPLAY